MVTVTGACKFCGQIATFQVPDGWEDSEETITQEATRRCKCQEAIIYSERESARNRADRYIDECVSGSIAELAKQAVPLVINQTIESIMINAGLGEKLTLKSSTKKYIKAKYTITKERALEE